LASSTVEFNDLDIYDNYASWYGGGIYTVQGGFEDENSSISPILDSLSNVITNRTIIRNNTAYKGGGIYSEKTSLLVLLTTIIQGNNAISRGTALGYGGGIYIESSGSTYSNNLNTVLIADNHATGKGGGIYMCYEVRIDIRTSTIAGNTANTTTGQGITCEAHSGYLTFRGSILAWNGSNNNSMHGLALSSTTQPSYMYSLVQGVTTTASYCLSGNTDPLFVSVSGSNYRLQSSSPCIDNGCCPHMTPTDLDGNSRTQGNSVDMGAYEYISTSTGSTVVPDANGIVYVKKGSTGNGSSWNNAAGELSDALYTAATNTSITQIWVTAGTYTPAYAADGSSSDPSDRSFVINASIYGGFPANSSNGTTMNHRNWQSYPTVLSGYLGQINNQHTYSYHVVILASNSSSINGFIIENGTAFGTGSIQVKGQTIQKNNGGGMYISSSNANISNVEVRNCQAANNGGGIYNISSGITLNNIWIMNNTANYGGGIYMENMFSSNSISKWHYISVIENQANIDGGGMYSSNFSFIFLNFYICGNRAVARGSAIFHDNNTFSQYYNTLIAQNEILVPSNGGGSIFNENSSPEFHNTTIAMCIPDGIGMINNNSNPNLCNTIIWSDNLLQGGQAVMDFGGNPTTYHHCLIQNMQPPGNNLPAGINPEFINFVATSNYQTNYGDYHLMPSSQCIDWGDHPCIATYIPLGDLDNNQRVLAQTDLGSYEFDPARPNPINNPYHKSTSNEDILPKENITTSNLSLSVYPNPIASSQQPALFLGEGNLYYENAIDVKVYSLEGKQIHSKTYSTGNATLDIPQLSSGMYIVTVRTQEGKVYNSKLVITQ
jgi:predicted outer membrane repeat protein